MRRIIAFFLATVLMAYSQTFTVKGTVSTTTGPVRFSSVSFVDSNDTTREFSAITDTAGNYNLDIIILSVKAQDNLPTKFELGQNYPNPFSSSTSIPYKLSERSNISVKIYNILGQLVREFRVGTQSAGAHGIVWDGTNDFGKKVMPGVYFYQLTMGNRSQAKKMLFGFGGGGIALLSPAAPASTNRLLAAMSAFQIESASYDVRVQETDSTQPEILAKDFGNVTIHGDTTLNLLVDQPFCASGSFFPLDSNTIALYNFNGNLRDLTGKHNGTGQGAFDYSYSNYCQAFHPLVAPAYMTIPDNVDFDTLKAFTVEALLTVDSLTPGHMAIMIKAAQGNSGWSFGFRNSFGSNHLAFWLNGTWYDSDIYFPVLSREIYVAASVRYGNGSGEITLYGGGAIQGRFTGLTISPPSTSVSYRIAMGNSVPGDQLFAAIDEIKISGAVRDSSDIAAQYSKLVADSIVDLQVEPLQSISYLVHRVGTWQGVTFFDQNLWMQTNLSNDTAAFLYEINPNTLAVDSGYPVRLASPIGHGGSIKFDPDSSKLWVADGATASIYRVDPKTGLYDGYVNLTNFFVPNKVIGNLSGIALWDKMLFTFQFAGPTALAQCYVFSNARLHELANINGKVSSSDLVDSFSVYLGNTNSFNFGIQGASTDPDDPKAIWIMYSSSTSTFSALAKIDAESSMMSGRAQILEYRRILKPGMEDIAIDASGMVYTGNEVDNKIYEFNLK